MTKDIEDVIHEMSEEEIARIRGGYTDPLFDKGTEIEYEGDAYRIIDYAEWTGGLPCYVVRPIGEDYVTRLGQDAVEGFATEVGG